MRKLLPEIKRMLESGMSQREVAERLGLKGDRPIHDLLKRERKKAMQVTPKQRGRKPARTLQEYKYENKRLKMEILLRSWEGSEAEGQVSSNLSSSGRISGIRHVHILWGIQERLL